jgi:hypothetical protein
MNAGDFFMGFSSLLLLATSPLRGAVKRIPLVSIPAILGVTLGIAAGFLAAVLVSPLALKVAAAGIPGYDSTQVYLGVEVIAAIVSFFLFGWLAVFIADRILLFLRLDYPRPEGIHHDHYPLFLDDDRRIIYRGIIFRNRWTAFLLAPLALFGVITTFRRVRKFWQDSWKELVKIRPEENPLQIISPSPYDFLDF